MVECLIKIIRMIVPFVFSGLVSYLATTSESESVAGVLLGFAIVGFGVGCYVVIRFEE